MASVTGKTSIKIDDLINDTVVSGEVVDGVLYLTSRGGAQIYAGPVGSSVDGSSFIAIDPSAAPYNAKYDGVTDDTAAVQQALDDAWTSSGAKAVMLKPGRTAGGGMATILVDKLRLNQGQTLCGPPGGMFTTRLKRRTSDGTPFIREKTAAEGGGGAQGISIRNLYIDCNSLAGDGVNLGNQQPAAGTNWGMNGVLENVHVRNAGGDGFSIEADAVTGWNISAYFNGGVGFKTTGHGSNNWFQISTSSNAGAELDLSATNDTFFGLHMEPSSAEAVIVRASGNTFHGVTAFLEGDVTDLFDLVGSISATRIYDVEAASATYKITGNWVKCELTTSLNFAAPNATGTYRFREWSDNGAGNNSAIVNVTRGTQIRFRDYGQLEARGFFRTGINTSNTSTGSYTVTDSVSVVICTGSTASFVVHLPSAPSYRGREITVVNKATQTVTVDVVGGGSGTVDYPTVAVAPARTTYISDGTNWIAIAS